MKMWCLQILLFILSIALSCVTSAAELVHVFGYEGREAKVSCSYGQGYESYEKYLCRNDCNDEDVLITTGAVKDKYSISDDKVKRVFTTTISNLRYTDAGKYWCGVSRTGRDFYTEVKLDVVTDSCCDSSTTVQSYESGSVSISCPYESQYQNNLKYICRGNQPSRCLQQAVVTSNNKPNRQFSLTDDKVLHKFTVTITSLTKKDSGSFLCGVQRNTGLDVFSAVVLEVKENSCCDSSTKVQSYEGGSVSISCPYESIYQNNLKYICRGNQPSRCLQQAVVTSNNKQNRQFSLTDDKVLRKFTVTITSLTKKDSGSFLCGVQRNTGLNVFSAVVLEVKENSCCDSSTKVQSYEGGSVSISCPYESQYQNNLKYICRGNQPSTCLQQAVVTSNNKQNRQFSLTDDKVLRKFTVTITSLTQKDSGSFLCGVQRNTGLNVFSAVVLEVKENSCCDSSTKVQSYEGGSVSISCPYESQYQNNLKYICRGNQPSTCLQQAVVTSNNKPNRQFSLTDDKVLRKFTVTITSLTQKDSGSFLCGVQRNTGLDVFSAVVLEVKENSCCDSSTKVQSYEGGSVSISCPYESQYQNNLKYICRGNQPSTCLQQAVVTSNNKQNRQFSLTDDKVLRKFTVTITSLTQKDSGSFLCGVQRNTGLDVFSAVVLEVKENSCCDSSTKVQSYEGGSVSISCPYESQYQNNLKYICRGNQPSTCLQQAVVTSNNKPNRQFSLTDDKVLRKFTVTITSVTQKDSGSFLCGVQRNTGLDVFSAVVLDVKENSCCDSSTKVQSYEGGSVSISCPYESQYQNNLKYICRGNQPSTCLQQAVVTSNNKRIRQFSLTDDKVLRKFTVTITSLTQKDSGSFLCGVQRNTGLDVFSAVVLEVKENSCCDSSTKVQSYEGGSVSISCPYESQYQNNLKYICRGNQPSTCLQQAVVTSNNKRIRQFSLTDDKVLRKFTVTITSLTQKDSGSFLCGVQRNTGLDVFSAVVLEVKEWCCVKSNELNGTVGRPLTMQCPYPPQHVTNRKFLCKGDHHRTCTEVVTSQSSSNQTDVRFTLQDDVSSSSFLVTISELKADDAGTYWCGSDSQWRTGNYTKIQLSVDKALSVALHSVVFIAPPVLLLILIIVLVFVCKYKCQKVPGTAATVNRTITKTADAEEVMGEADIYENKDIVVPSKQRTSKQQETCPQYDDAEEDNDYQNFSIREDIYCNEFHGTGYRR